MLACLSYCFGLEHAAARLGVRHACIVAIAFNYFCPVWHVRKMFAACDESGQGRISSSDAARVFNALGIKVSAQQVCQVCYFWNFVVTLLQIRSIFDTRLGDPEDGNVGIDDDMGL